ncbi:MAG TPA: TonB-dependent receptor [Pseudomonadales bacterium]
MGKTVQALAVGAVVFAPAVVVQPPAFAQSEARVLEEVVVTARKREESLQEVGMSLSALSGDDLRIRFDADLQTLQNMSPNLIISDLQQGPGSPAAIAIRGIGTTDVEKNFDPTVGVVVDGVFIGVNSGAMLKAIDLESVEVLRGPQGTLFGRNSIGGVINVKRGRPDFDGFSGSARAGAGNHGGLELDAFLNLTATDNLAFRLGGAKRESDGWFYNATLDRDVGESDYWQISPSVRWKPTETTEFYYRYDKTEQEQDANTLHNLAQPDQVFCALYGQCAQGLQTPQSGEDYTVLQNDDPPYQTFFDTETHIVNASWDIDERYGLEFVYGRFETDEEVYQDWDSTPLTLYHTDRPATWEQDSYELRLNYSGDRLSYTAGAYYWESDYHIDLTSYIGFGAVLGVPGAGFDDSVVFPVFQTVAQKTESYAFFVEADYRLADRWTLTLGGRYTDDEKESAVIDPLTPELAIRGNPDNPFEASWNEFTPKVGLRFDATDSLMLYALYSRGFRAGGFNGRPGGGEYVAASTPYDPEKVDNYEIGVKSEWFDGRMRLNASAFVMEYQDKQEEQSVPVSGGTGQQTLVVNASEATISGVEIDFSWLATDYFALEGNLGLLDAEYDELEDPVLGVDLSHLELRRAPDVTATVAPVLTVPLGAGQLTARAALRYVDDMELTFLNSPQSSVDSHTVLDASVTYSLNNLSISVWGLNLTEDDSWTQAYDVGANPAFPGLWTYTAIRPPRTYGAVVSWDF